MPTVPSESYISLIQQRVVQYNPVVERCYHWGAVDDVELAAAATVLPRRPSRMKAITDTDSTFHFQIRTGSIAQSPDSFITYDWYHMPQLYRNKFSLINHGGLERSSG